MPTRVVLLGATGSIGTQAMELIATYPGEFTLAGAISGHRVRALAESLVSFPDAPAVVIEPDDALLPGMGAGTDAACELVARDDVDLVLIGGGGAAALAPTLTACERGKLVAIATKEVLVMAGELVTETARRCGARLLPVDSEHSAIWQCLRGEDPSCVARILLTASGGAVRDLPLDSLADVTPDQALAHPNWTMGPKVTIDSATMVNKGLEVIEAHFLFSVPYERIEVLMHPQSAIHSAVEFCDGTSIAQLGRPDMRAPIALALTGGRRLQDVVSPIRLTDGSPLSFLPLDEARYPALGVVRRAGERGGTVPAVLNAANEVAVEAFLDRRIRFTDIAELLERVTGDYLPSQGDGGLAEVLAADRWGRERASSLVEQAATLAPAGG